MNIKEKIGFLEKKHLRALYMGKYSLSILGETQDSFILRHDGSDALSKDSSIREEFSAQKVALGFSSVDNGADEKIVNKTDTDVAGKWQKLVSYKGWIIRVIKETDDQYQLLGNGGGIARKLLLDRVGRSKYGLKWVPKSECEDV